MEQKEGCHMENKIIEGKTIKEWKEQYPLMNEVISTEEVFWTNSKYGKFEEAIKKYLYQKQM